jgi:hypothetical protein
MPEHHFPPPWSVDEADSKLDRRCFIVREIATGQALDYFYFEDEPSCRSVNCVRSNQDYQWNRHEPMELARIGSPLCRCHAKDFWRTLMRNFNGLSSLVPGFALFYHHAH